MVALDVELTTQLPGPVRLRTLTAADGEAFAAHVAGDLERLSEYLPWPARTDDPEGAATWLAAYDRGDDGRVLVAGAWSGDDLVAGVVLFHHDPESAAVELGCWSVGSAAGKGVVSASCRQALRVARHDLAVERVSWQCDPRNTASSRLAARLGFVHEGTLRSAYVLRGERTDVAAYGLVGAEIDAALG